MGVSFQCDCPDGTRRRPCPHVPEPSLGEENRRRDYEEMILRFKWRYPQVDDKLRRAWGVPELKTDRTFDEVWADAERLAAEKLR